MRKPSLSTEAVKLDAPALAFENVSVKARSKTLVAEISGVVNKGEIMAVMGLSGSGKSTFLRALRGEHAPLTSLNGEVLVGEGCKVGFMSDNEPLLEHLTVYETLKFSLLIMNPSMTTTSVNATASLTAKNLGLERCYETFVKDLSWGERKRLQVGQQMVWSCNVILMDEPLTGLDSVSALKVAWTFRELVDKRNYSIIYSCHQPRHEVFKTFDKLVILDHGPESHGRTPDFEEALSRVYSEPGFAASSDFEAEESDPSLKGIALQTMHSQKIPTPPVALAQFTAAQKEPLQSMQSSVENKRRLEPAHFVLDALCMGTNADFVEAVRRNGLAHMRAQSTQYSVGLGYKLMKKALQVDGPPIDFQAEFHASAAWKFTEGQLKNAREWGQLTPYTPSTPPTDKLFMRSILSSQRWYLNLFRDTRALMIELGLGLIVSLVVGSCFYKLGGDAINLDYPTNNAAIFYSIAAMIIALNQFPLAQYCHMYQMFTHERIAGLRSSTEFVVEAVMCTWWFAIYFALLSFVTYIISTPSAGNSASKSFLILGNGVVLSLSGLAIAWICAVFSHGHAVQAISIYAMLESVMLGTDGFVIPVAYIRKIWIWMYYINPRTWYLKAQLVDTYCGKSCGSYSETLSTSSIDQNELREDIVYKWLADIYETTGTGTTYYTAYILNFFDLWNLSVRECLLYSVCIMIVLLVLVYLELKAVTLWRVIQHMTLPRPWNTISRSSYTVPITIGLSLLLAFVLSATVKNYNYYTINQLFESTSSYGYETSVSSYCPTCFGLPKISTLSSDIVEAGNFDLMIARMDMTTNHLLQIVPSRDLLVSDGDMFQPLTTALNVSSLKGMLDYAPLDIYSFSTDLDKVLALENAEFKVAWIFANMGSNMFELLTTIPSTNEFPISKSTKLASYMLSTYNTTLQEALDAERLYWFTRLPGFDDLPTANHVGNTEFLDVNPYVLWIRNDTSGELETLAIQLGSDAALYEVLTPLNDEYTWKGAKAFARHAISMRGVLAHVVDIHHIICAFAPATSKISSTHPLSEVLSPSMNDRGLRVLINVLLYPSIAPLPYVDIDTSSVLAFLGTMEGDFVFSRDAYYPRMAKSHGLWNVSDGLYLPLRPMLHSLWTLCETYATGIVDYAWASDTAVIEDSTVLTWASALTSSSGGNIGNLTQNGTQEIDGVTCTICSKQDMVEVLTSYFFLSARHSVSRFPQLTFDLFFYPLACWNLYAKSVPSSTVPYTEQTFLDLFQQPEGIVQGFRFLTATAVPVQTQVAGLPDLISDTTLSGLAQDFVDGLEALASTYEAEYDFFIWRKLELYSEN